MSGLLVLLRDRESLQVVQVSLQRPETPLPLTVQADGSVMSGVAPLKHERHEVELTSHKLLKLESREERWQAGVAYITRNGPVAGG